MKILAMFRKTFLTLFFHIPFQFQTPSQVTTQTNNNPCSYHLSLTLHLRGISDTTPRSNEAYLYFGESIHKRHGAGNMKYALEFLEARKYETESLQQSRRGSRSINLKWHWISLHSMTSVEEENCLTYTYVILRFWDGIQKPIL